jgi:hypothetical protein
VNVANVLVALDRDVAVLRSPCTQDRMEGRSDFNQRGPQYSALAAFAVVLNDHFLACVEGGVLVGVGLKTIYEGMRAHRG